MRTNWLLILIAFNVFWGGTYSAYKDLSQWLNPGQLVTLRYGLATVLLFVCWPFMPGKSPCGRDLLKTCAMGLLAFVAAPRLQVIATRAGQAGDMSVLVALEPLVTTLGAALFLREVVPPNRWLGFLFGMIGVVLLANIWRPDFRVANLGANLIFVSSFFCESAFSIMGKPLSERSSFLKVTTLSMMAGTVLNLALDGPSTFEATKHLPLRGWAEMVGLATICTSIGCVVWFAAIRVLPVNAVAMTVFMQPFTGTAFAILLIGEKPHWGQLWGGLAIAAGLVLGLRKVNDTKR